MKKYFLFGLVAMATLALAACASTNPSGQSDSSAMAEQDNAQDMVMNWYGGPAYTGAPNLEATAALVRAGGGADNFSFAQALVSMLGEDTVNAEVAKLQKQYGQDKVKGLISGMDYAIKDGLKRATEAGVTLPQAPADLKGKKLAKALIKAGTAPDGTFWAGHLFDVAISHELHNQVMTDINNNVSAEADVTTHQILNQAMYDVAQALGMTDVKLATLH